MDKKERVKCFVKLMKLTTLEIDDENYSIYEDQIKENFELAIKNNTKYGETSKLVPIAYQYYKEIQSLGQKKYLLHGDLGNKNIIKSADTWKVIDPQGVIAEEIFGIIKFTRAEIENEVNIRKAIEDTIYYLSVETNYSKELIAKVTFIELVHVNCFRITTNDIGEYINRNIILAKEILKYLKENTF